MTVREYFDPRTRGSNWRTEALAGVTTFMTLAYIVVVNADILGAAKMDRQVRPWVWVLCALFAAGYAASFILPSGGPG